MRTTERDVVIRDGLLFDGSGTAPRTADLLVRHGRIAEVGGVSAPRRPTDVDARGLALCPGFIDIHGHSDAALLHPQAPDLLGPFVRQGITTQVVGNCGLGVAPAPKPQRDTLLAFMSLILPRGFQCEWESTSEYLQTLETSGVPLNVALLAPHGAIRTAVLGSRDGAAGAADLERMNDWTAEALAAGAFGLSAGLIYPPGMWSDTDELVALCDTVAAHDGVFACHVRGSSELAVEAERELIEIAQRTGVRVQHSHHEAFGPAFWHLARETMALEDRARANGIDIGSDVIPYHAVNTTLLAIFPPWALEGGVGALCDRLDDESTRRRIVNAIDSHEPTWPPWDGGWAHNLVRAGGWQDIVILQAASAEHAHWFGHSLEKIAEIENRTPFECAAELVRAAQGDAMARYHGISGAPGDDGVLHDLLVHPHHAVAVDVILKGSGVSHPGAYGALPRVLGRYARELGWFGLSEAIRKSTSLPAHRIGLVDRGRLAPGFAADMVLFDPAAIAETATYAQPQAAPTGLHKVWINGRLTVDRDALIAGRNGRVLRRV